MSTFSLPQTPAPEPESFSAHGTVTIVDNSPINLKILSKLLQKGGYAVRAFQDGLRAMKSARQIRPDLFLLDVNMPEMNGFEVCMALKQDHALEDIPVMFITALSEQDDKNQGFEHGAVDYLTKPFDAREILARVKTHIRIHRQKKELVRINKELYEAQELRERLTHMLVHDLRSPLSGMYGALQVMELEEIPESMQEYVDELKKSTKKLIGMVSTILDFDKIKSGQLQLQELPVDLSELARQVVRDLAPLVERRRVELYCLSGSTECTADPALLERVFTNLLSNAIAHTSRTDGLIQISTEREHDHISVQISNNGPRISPRLQERLFDTYTQEPGKRTGSGLGLAYCKLAVEAHGGTIDVVRGYTSGAAFRFTIPLKECCIVQG